MRRARCQHQLSFLLEMLENWLCDSQACVKWNSLCSGVFRGPYARTSDGVKDMTHEAKAKAKDLTCHAALKPQTLYTVQC